MARDENDAAFADHLAGGQPLYILPKSMVEPHAPVLGKYLAYLRMSYLSGDPIPTCILIGVCYSWPCTQWAPYFIKLGLRGMSECT